MLTIAFAVADITDHETKADPHDQCRGIAASGAAKRWYAEAAMDQQVIRGNVDRQGDQRQYHHGTGIGLGFTVTTQHLIKGYGGYAPGNASQVALCNLLYCGVKLEPGQIERCGATQ